MKLIEDKRSPCDTYRLWPDADKRVQRPTIMYAINRGGEHGFDTRNPVWAVCDDPLRVSGCVVCLCEFVGSPVTLRYHTRDLRLVNYGEERFEHFRKDSYETHINTRL